MGKLIYGLLIGSLILALLICVGLAIGLNAWSIKLQKQIISTYLERDISVLTDSLEYHLVPLNKCPSLQSLNLEFKGVQVDTIKDVYVFQKVLIQKTVEEMDCIRRQTKEAMNTQEVQTFAICLHSYATLLDIAVRHSYLDLSTGEKDALASVFRISRTIPPKEGLLTQISMAFPILEGIQHNLLSLLKEKFVIPS